MTDRAKLALGAAHLAVAVGFTALTVVAVRCALRWWDAPAEVLEPGGGRLLGALALLAGALAYLGVLVAAAGLALHLAGVAVRSPQLTPGRRAAWLGAIFVFTPFVLPWAWYRLVWRPTPLPTRPPP